MKPMFSLSLGFAFLMAMQPLPATDATQDSLKSDEKAAAKRLKETGEQQIARHQMEVKEAETFIHALMKESTLLTDPNFAGSRAQFHAEIAKVKGIPEFKQMPQSTPKTKSSKDLRPKTNAQLKRDHLESVLTMMSKQANVVCGMYPELRNYAEELLRWHRQLFELQIKHSDNPALQQLVRHHLQLATRPTGSASSLPK